VRPAGDRDPGPGPWRGGQRPGGGALADDGPLDDACILADAALLGAEKNVSEIQLPEDADADMDGKASTATTSALVV
jgi:hypothetical protein